MIYRICLFIFFINLFTIQTSAQNHFNPYDLLGTSWYLMKVEGKDTTIVNHRADACFHKVELRINPTFDSTTFTVFNKEQAVLSIGNFDLETCDFDPITYKAELGINSCPDLILIHLKNNRIWYFINQAGNRMKYKLKSYTKGKEIILKKKRGYRKEKELIFRR